MIHISEILEFIDSYSYTGDKNIIIKEVKSLATIEGAENILSWCNDENLNQLRELESSAVVIVGENTPYSIQESKNCIIVQNPRRIFQEVLIKFFSKKRSPQISPNAIIDSTSKVGKNAFIGNNVVVEENCEIGDNVTILHNTVVLHGTKIGNNVSIGANNTIGGTGFGYEKNTNGDFELIPHLGHVYIGDNVDIGNNTCIDRAVMGSTILEENVKIDNLVHIAHGVKVRRNAVVIANAMVAGSVEIGENSWIAPSVSVMNKKNIGKNSLVGLGAVVTKPVGDNVIVAGNPAKFIRSIK